MVALKALRDTGRLDFEAHYRPVRGGHELEAVRLLSRTPGGLVGWSAASTGPYRPRALPVACRGTAREVAAVLAFIACTLAQVGRERALLRRVVPLGTR